jgi:hypothetical protein
MITIYNLRKAITKLNATTKLKACQGAGFD